ncbi:hypothetical protein GIB67_031290 [Kingdonia uniflora]|uniref:cysteine dioxygenase n=1 Tax=Kingdonia uniflora TaxID=39325 RepID=A0A7J7P5P5_9MAGN|nr:hypothetical protein GIB67_031290 [Kingdonia uniflora]
MTRKGEILVREKKKKRGGGVVGCDSDSVIRKKRCGRREKGVRVVPTELYFVCRDVFKGHGTVSLPKDVQRLRCVLDNMKPEDVGLSGDLLFFRPRSIVKGAPRITYTTIYKCENFSMCMFFLPPTAVIPLHNHPGMTVFSKLLLGSMHIKSYDWVYSIKPDDPLLSSQLRLARLKADNVFTAPCNTSVLYPTSGGNIHAFTAITPCVVLDVLGPPYSKEDGRDCEYYRDFHYSEFAGNDTAPKPKDEEHCYGWLEEIEMPKDLGMDGIEYLGPQIIEKSCQRQ